MSVLREAQWTQGAQEGQAFLAGEIQGGFREEWNFEMSLEGKVGF